MKFEDIKYSDYRRVKDRIDITLAVLIWPVITSLCLFYIPYMMHFDVFSGFNIKTYEVIISAVLPFFSFYSVARVTATFHDPLKQEFVEYEKPTDTLQEKVIFICGLEHLRITAAVIAIVYLLIPTKTLNKGLHPILIGENESVILKYAVIIGILAVFAILFIAAHITAMGVWKDEELRKANCEKTEKGRLTYTSQFLLAALSYPIGGLCLGVLVPIGLSLLPFFTLATDPIFYVPAITVIFLPPIIRFIRAMKIRFSLIRRIKKLCKKKKYRLSRLKAPYRSVYSVFKGENFTVNIGGQIYSVKLIGAPRKNTPLTLYPDGIGCFRRTARFFKAEIFSYDKKFRYDYESKYPKILVVNPVAKFLFTVGNGSSESVTPHFNISWRVGRVYATPVNTGSLFGSRFVEIDNGDKIGDHKVFAATAFLNALERNCLDR